MPSVSQKRRVVDNADSDDEPDSTSASSPPTSPGATSTHKRARIEQRNGMPNGQARESSENSEQQDDDDEDDDELENHLPEADFDADAEEEILDDEQNYEITAEEQPFAPGAIVRIKLLNFVTYTSTEFKPGPSLNMIIGPNGSGKSSIVCAICLGLGWSPKHLGRSETVGDFVKHGNQEATIEIELQGQEGERNPIIKRKIMRDNNGTSYTLNRMLVNPNI